MGRLKRVSQKRHNHSQALNSQALGEMRALSFIFEFLDN